MQMTSLEVMLWKRALHIYINICTYLELIFLNTIHKIDIGMANSFLGMALFAFWKGALHLFFVL